MSPGCGGGCGREEREALVAMWFTALQVQITSKKETEFREAAL